MSAILSLAGLGKTYESGLTALDHVDLDIHKGEIFALLGPNGGRQDDADQHRLRYRHAERTGTITVAGHDAIRNYRAARSMIGLVPQEMATDAFVSVLATVRFSRRLFGKGRERGVSRGSAARPLAVGQAQGPDPRAFGRHEAPRADRQGAGARTRHPVPRRTDRGRRCRACAATCGSWCTSCAPRARRSSSPRITSRKPRKWPTVSGVISKGKDHRRRREERTDEEARQAPDADFAAGADGRDPARTGVIGRSIVGGRGHQAALCVRRAGRAYRHPLAAAQAR